MKQQQHLLDISPPIHAENSVLATLIFKPNLMTVAATFLNAAVFGGRTQKNVAAAIWKAYNAKLEINPAAISAMLPDIDIFGLLPMADITNFESNLEIVKTEYIRRQETQIALQLASDLSAGEIEYTDAIGKAQAAREALHRTDVSRITKAQQIENIIDWVGRCIDSKGMVGIPTGYNDMNALTGGWQPGDLIVLAARPSMGKSTYALASLIRSALAGVPVLFLTCEMSVQDILLKANAFFSGVNITELRQGNISKEQMQVFLKACDKITDLPIFVEGIVGKNITEITAIIHEYKRLHGVQLVVLDYLQLVTPNRERGKTREQEISEMSRSLKIAAKKLNIAIIALSQLSRAVETRGGSKRPQVSDLRESGAIEQDADIITFLYRPEYYGILEDESGNSLRGITEVIIAKHRNGALKTLKRRFVVTDFKELDEQGNDEQTNYNPTIVRAGVGDDIDIPF